MFADMIATAFDSDAPLDARRAIIRRDGGEIEMVELPWGLKPKEAGGRPSRFVRAEERKFLTHRCLIPASEFRVSRGGRRYRFSLEDHNWFYLAGIWRAATSEWPEAYAILTVEANAEVAHYQERQGAVLRRSQRMAWLDHTVPQATLLRALPPRSFSVEQMTPSGASQRVLAF